MNLIALDDFILADYGIPPALLDNKSSTPQFGAERRAGVYGHVYFGSSSSPATWNVIFQCPDEAAREALSAVLTAPRKRQLRLLALRETYTQDRVWIEAAVLSDQPHGSDWNTEVLFESNDSVWYGEAVTTVAKSLTSPLDQILHLPAPGDTPTHPVLRITPTQQRTVHLPEVGWTKRQRWTITNHGDEPMVRYAVRIDLGDTAALVAAGKALPAGYDLRVWLDGLEQPRLLDDWNTSDTKLWLIVPNLPVGNWLTYDVVYGNPAAEAGHLSDLTYPDHPAFDPTVSTNAIQTYRSGTDAAQAGKGLWPLLLPESGGSPDFTVPASWQPALTFENPLNTDEYLQGPARQLIINEVQTIAATGTVSGGTYTITIAAVSQTTAPIAYNADDVAILAAIELLSAIEPGDVFVDGGPLPGTPITITYTRKQWRGKNVAQATVNSGSLTGGGSYGVTTTTPGDLWYQTTFNAARWREEPFYEGGAAINAGVLSEYAGSYPFDGVVLHNPFGISGFVSAGVAWLNYANIMTVVTTTVGDETESSEVLAPTDPFTRLVGIARNSGGDDWYVIDERFAETDGVETFAWFLIPPTPMKHLGVAVWPHGRPSIPDDAVGGGQGLIYGDVQVEIDIEGKLLVEQTEPETDIYEIAMELRLHGGANAVGPYHTLLIGNPRQASGPGTPRLAVALGQQGAQIDTATLKHDVWDTDFLVRDEAVSAHAVRGLEGYLADGQTGEVRSTRWLPLAPPRRTVVNGSFDADIGGWQLFADGIGITYDVEHDPTVGGEQDGALHIDITANSGSDAVAYVTAQRFGVHGQEAVEMSAWVRTSHADLHPRLFIAWHRGDEDEETVALSNDPPWADDPDANEPYGRSFAAVVPAGVTHFRLGLAADANVSAATGEVWFDDVRLNDNELFVGDPAMGELDLEVLVRPRWVR